MKIRQTPVFNKKAIIIALASVLLVALIIVGGWSFAAIQAESAFASGVASARQQLRNDLADTQTQLKAAVQKGDTGATGKVLSTQANRIVSDAESIPEAWDILGMPLVSQNKLKDRETLQAKAHDLSSALNTGAEILNYEHDVLEPLMAIKNLTGRDAKEQQALATGWQSLLDQLKKITPPSIAQQLHASILKIVGDTQAVLAQLPDLYQKKDEAGFAAKTQQLQSVIATLQNLGDVVKQLDTSADKTIGDAFQAFSSAVQ